MKSRERWEETEKIILSQYAKQSTDTRGRERSEGKCDIRTEFQRDRDRILHSKSFRRLKHKTQVFISPEGDHYRTRLTHTLEVSQIARTLAKALQMNEDLTEAIALGHDLGHTPFGHTGEHVLDELCSFGFKHRQQSLRVVEKLENGKGLNLTWEVRDGILNHSGNNIASTLEGQIVHYSDRIAYINHDIEDALRAGILKEEDLPQGCIAVLGTSKRARIDTMIKDIIETSENRNRISMSPKVQQASDQLREFMFQAVYFGSKAKEDEGKAENIIRNLFFYFMNDPRVMSEEQIQRLNEEEKERVVADYIAGMTDRYAIKKFNDLFIPSPWSRY
ncbi:MAG TPA: deoxyguanosinetriphosphate triphosphohydrolase [Eubacteriaceae bacterium]|nr:deoxyguanosinetriphosphate triphosphohydrolase [Eubacteriaceae bacterium]